MSIKDSINNKIPVKKINLILLNHWKHFLVI
jgi:hypothetical protein